MPPLKRSSSEQRNEHQQEQCTDDNQADRRVLFEKERRDRAEYQNDNGHKRKGHSALLQCVLQIKRRLHNAPLSHGDLPNSRNCGTGERIEDRSKIEQPVGKVDRRGGMKHAEASKRDHEPGKHGYDKSSEGHK